MVTWGPNTVSTFNTSGSTPSVFGTPAAASAPTTSSLWSTPTPSTSASPAASSSFSFSSQPNPVNSPAPTAPSLFGATPAAATASASNAFQQILGAPQQAALQAHMTAQMQQEKIRLTTQMMQLHAAYSPATTPVPGPGTTGNGTSSPCRFQYIFYDPITQAQRLEKLSLPSYPPKPPHISDERWYNALAHNPDPDEYIPVVVTSAEGLHSRLVAQQSKMKLHTNYVNTLNRTLEQREERNQVKRMQLNSYRKKNRLIRSRIHDIMRKFEMCRGKNVPLQESEREALEKLFELAKGVETCAKLLEGVQRDGVDCQRQWEVMKLQKSNMGYAYGGGADAEEGALEPKFKDEVMEILIVSKRGIDEMKKVMKKSERDMGIMKSH